ncbi:MAG TPA: rod shape-determining protein MreC [Bryobacteraceae bacterium]|nr:rod shape-determining protein MreC [Bryobacteraceae bacterium]
MDLLLSRYRNMTALLLVLLAQLVLLAWQVKTRQDVRLIRVWSVTAVTPLARVLEFVREHTVGVVENYLVLVNVRNDNRRLTDEVGKLKLENRFLRTELETADRARALQAFQQRTMSRTLPARVIGTGTGTNARVVFVDQGSGAGVKRGMAVVTPEGIVGKVLAAYPTASQVLLVTDNTFAAGVISGKSRVHGTVRGLGQSKVVVDYVQNEEKVENGETFYTSGDDRIFPKGMPVGRATVVREGKTFKEIFLVPDGLQGGLEEVLIVLESVHGEIPDTSVAQASGDVYIGPPVEQAKPAVPVTTPAAPAGSTGAAAGSAPAAAAQQPAVITEADRIRDRYKRIGEAQGHTYGEGAGRVPNFNVNPDAAPRTAVPSPAQPGTAGVPRAVSPPAPANPGPRPQPQGAQQQQPVPPPRTPAPAGGSEAARPQPQ